jgi:RNA polymerase sigma-70 factor (ECF subfamily)
MGCLMSRNAPQDVTLLLQDWCRGERDALDRLIPLVYDELRRIAHRYMIRERPGRTLQTTALVNEAYMRLIDAGRVQWEARTQFFGVAANLMRRVLVESARARSSKKRGGDARRLVLDEAAVFSPVRDQDFVALDDALNALAAVDPRGAQVVELRFFGGLSVEETAEVLKVSAVTVMRDWRATKIWLLRELERRHGDES